MKKIIGDLDKFIVYEILSTGEYIAVDKVKTDLMDVYYRDFNKFKDAPEDLTIEGFRLIPEEPNSLRIDLNRKTKTKVKDLTPTIIRLYKK